MEFNDFYINQLWDEFNREQQRILNLIRSSDDKKIRKQLKEINNIMNSLISLRDLKKTN